MTPEQEILEDALAFVGQRIATFADEIRSHAASFPLDRDADFQTPSVLWVEMDAFSKRYEMTQDQIVRKLFRSVLAVERGIVVRNKSLGDVIEAMAQIGIVADAGEWHKITNVRNMLAHDYLVTRRDAARLLNQAWEFAPKLIDMFAKVDAHVSRHVLLDEGRDS